MKQNIYLVSGSTSPSSPQEGHEVILARNKREACIKWIESTQCSNAYMQIELCYEDVIVNADVVSFAAKQMADTIRKYRADHSDHCG